MNATSHQHPAAYRPPRRPTPSADCTESSLELADGAELTAEDVRAIKLLADAGLVPPFRHLSVA